MNTKKKQALGEMRNVANDPELGRWSTSQRAIVGLWLGWIESDDDLEKAIDKQPVEEKKKKGKFESFFDNFLAACLLALVGFFLFEGGMWFHHQNKLTDTVSRSIDKDVTCYSSDLSGMSCLPNWLIDLRLKKSDLVE